MLNWHPVVEYEIREIERERWLQQLRIEELQREIAHEQRMQQLAKEDERLEKEDERLRKEDERLAELDRRMSELDAKIAALWPSSTSSSPQAPPPERDSPT
jgi:chromosome segregation ATPase